jgi:hypothetical protein
MKMKQLQTQLLVKRIKQVQMILNLKMKQTQAPLQMMKHYRLLENLKQFQEKHKKLFLKKNQNVTKGL